MPRIDTVGTYRGRITNHGLSTTKKGYPNFGFAVTATLKYVDDPEGMAHFGIEEPGWVSWEDYQEELSDYLVLFNDAEEFTPDTALMNYEQVQKATGWDGTSFDTLNNGSLCGKEILFRVEEDTYNDKTRLRVNWIDAPDASPTRELRRLDAKDVSALNSKLKGIKKATPAVAKPGAKPAAKPVKTEDPAPQKAAKKATPPKKAPPVVDPEETDTSTLPTEVSQADGWEYVCLHKGGNTDSDIEEAWIAACSEVGEDKDEADFTETDWAAVRDIVIRDLALEA